MGLFSKLKASANPSSSKGYAPPAGPPPIYYAPPSGPPPSSSSSKQAATSGRSGVEDPLAALKKYDTSFLIDDSESMEMFWEELSGALGAVIQKAAQYDEDGVDIAFFNS